MVVCFILKAHFFYTFLTVRGVALVNEVFSKNERVSSHPLIIALKSICELYSRILKIYWLADNKNMNFDDFMKFFEGSS
jgi:hypothetical protein